MCRQVYLTICYNTPLIPIDLLTCIHCDIVFFFFLWAHVLSHALWSAPTRTIPFQYHVNSVAASSHMSQCFSQISEFLNIPDIFIGGGKNFHGCRAGGKKQHKNATIHQLTTMVSTYENILFRGPINHLLYNHQWWWPDTIIIAQKLAKVIIKVKGHQHQMLAGG